MNVFDFDGTIYRGDSSVDFFFFCLRKHPSTIKMLPRFTRSLFYYKLGKIEKETLKESFFSFLCNIPDIKTAVALFWDSNQSKIKSWYIEIHRDDDIVVSASPQFLLAEICRRLQINHLIASEVNPSNGCFFSKNCHGAEKVTRLFEKHPDAAIDNFFSDSLTYDKHLARLANRAWYVTKDAIQPWPTKQL